MKILMATHYFASHRGGIEIVGGELFLALSARGEEVIWMAGDCTAVPEPVGASHAVPLRVLNFVERKIGLPFPIPTLSSLRRIRAAVREADVVLLHDCLYLTNIAAFLFAKFRAKPTIIVQHIGFVPYKSRFLNVLMKTANCLLTQPMLARSEQVVFMSETTRKCFSGVPFRRAPQIIFNGVDSNLFRPVEGEYDLSKLRRKFDLPDHRPLVLFVGRFVEKKGMPIMKLLVQQRPTCTWVFAGWGPLDPSTWESENVKVFSNLSGVSLSELYRACDLFVLPSIGEGFPLVLQEALACGLPVICGSETLAADSALKEFAEGRLIHLG